MRIYFGNKRVAAQPVISSIKRMTLSNDDLYEVEFRNDSVYSTSRSNANLYSVSTDNE